jgi:hypothetical protein
MADSGWSVTGLFSVLIFAKVFMKTLLAGGKYLQINKAGGIYG